MNVDQRATRHHLWLSLGLGAVRILTAHVCCVNSQFHMFRTALRFRVPPIGSWHLIANGPAESSWFVTPVHTWKGKDMSHFLLERFISAVLVKKNYTQEQKIWLSLWNNSTLKLMCSVSWNLKSVHLEEFKFCFNFTAKNNEMLQSFWSWESSVNSSVKAESGRAVLRN